MNMTETRDALAYALQQDAPVFLRGSPGVGKTAIVDQVAASQGRGLVVETLSTMETVDLRGLPQTVGGGVVWSEPDFLVRLRAAGPEAVLFIDEANANAASMQVCLMQLVLARRVGSHNLPEGTRIVLAGNKMTDRAAAQRMPTALTNRLTILDVEPDLESWLKWAASVQLDPIIVALMSWRGAGTTGRPGLLHNFDPKVEGPFQSPRSWAQAAKLIGAPEHVRHALLAGTVGEAGAAEAEGFIQLRKELPPLPQIMADPAGAPVPSKVSLQYLVTIALSRAAKVSNFQAVLTYTARLGKEFGIVAATDAVRRDPALAETQAYVWWAAENSDVLV